MFGVPLMLLLSHGIAFVGGVVVSIVVPKFYAWVRKAIGLAKQL